MNTDYLLTSKDALTELAKANGIRSWNELTKFVKNLPYGRNKNRAEFGLVLSEKKGTCSSKHALLKRIAAANHIPDVKLMIGIYRMNQSNTPKIGTELTAHSIAYIPEAHCYLKINDKRVDFTAKESEFQKIEQDIIREKEIEPEQVIRFKVEYHKEFIKNWIRDHQPEFDFDQIWRIREKCIGNLTE